jgi:hypothetical protein
MSEIREAWKATAIPTLPAVAVKGEGVIETFQALLELVYDHVDQQHDFGSKFGIGKEEFIEGILRHLRAPKPEPPTT